MSRRGAAGLFWIVSGAYLAALLWADRESGAAGALSRVAPLLPALAALAMASWCIRYLRWHWLLSQAGYSCTPWRGFLAYLSGFAYTLTPGKLGELVRIRYLTPLGVPAHVVVSAFVYERTLDLLVVLALATLAVHEEALAQGASFVLVIVLVVGWCVRHPKSLQGLHQNLTRAGWPRLAGWLQTVLQGIFHTSQWLTWRHLLVSTMLGVIAWGLTAGAFALLLRQLHIVLPWPTAFSLYPMGMLAGAASMLPGGVGSTELVLVTLLARHAVPLQIATVAAVTIRLATLWLATIFGFAAMLALSRWDPRSNGASPPHDGLR